MTGIYLFYVTGAPAVCNRYMSLWYIWYVVVNRYLRVLRHTNVSAVTHSVSVRAVSHEAQCHTPSIAQSLSHHDSAGTHLLGAPWAQLAASSLWQPLPASGKYDKIREDNTNNTNCIGTKHTYTLQRKWITTTRQSTNSQLTLCH